MAYDEFECGADAIRLVSTTKIYIDIFNMALYQLFVVFVCLLATRRGAVDARATTTTASTTTMRPGTLRCVCHESFNCRDEIGDILDGLYAILGIDSASNDTSSSNDNAYECDIPAGKQLACRCSQCNCVEITVFRKYKVIDFIG